MLYSNLVEYYRIVKMFLDYKYPPEYVENLIPFERELHINFIMQDLKEGVTTTPNFEAPED
jgi:hypothetical protein